jgi:hypothetical protein
MFVASPRHTHNLMSEQPNARYSLPIPMVYENVRVELANWEYHILTIDAREETLPDAARLNELGREGWLLVGIVDQGATGRSSLIHYYFVRQKV